jgi:HEAT repeat protein
LLRASNTSSGKERESDIPTKEESILFDKALNRQVAKAVISALGYFGPPSAVDSLVYILELEHSVDVNNVANNLDALKIALTTMFGGAAYVVDGKIVEALGKQLGIDSQGKTIQSMILILKSRIKEFVPELKTG